MPRNTLVDLNDHLFIAIERLNEDDLEGEALQDEIGRAKAICGIAGTVIENANAAMRAVELRDQLGQQAAMPRMLTGGSE